MSFIKNERAAQTASYYSEGLRSYLIKVYNYMAMALGITGLIALLVSSSQAAMSAIYGTPLHWIIAFAPLGIVFFMSYKLYDLSMETVFVLFFSFASVMGLSISSIFLLYTSESIARVFFISSSMFGSMAYYGNVTKRDLSQFGSFLMMGLIGLIVSSVVNLFFMSTALQFAISIVSVILFTGMTAYDAQRIKDMYFKLNDGSSESVNKVAIIGATSMYFNYINIFLSLLRIMGDRRQ